MMLKNLNFIVIEFIDDISKKFTCLKIDQKKKGLKSKKLILFEIFEKFRP